MSKLTDLSFPPCQERSSTHLPTTTVDLSFDWRASQSSSTTEGIILRLSEPYQKTNMYFKNKRQGARHLWLRSWIYTTPWPAQTKYSTYVAPVSSSEMLLSWGLISSYQPPKFHVTKVLRVFCPIIKHQVFDLMNVLNLIGRTSMGMYRFICTSTLLKSRCSACMKQQRHSRNTA